MPKKRELKIGNKIIDDSSDCFVVAEIGQNHQGDVEVCKRLFEAAKFCGADAVKLQKRNNRTLYTRKFFDSPYNFENAFGPTYGKHRQALEFNKKEYRKLKKYAEKLGLIFFATAWDESSGDFLEDLDVPAFKIASADLINTPLLKYIAKFKKPMIVSTGAATIDDVKRAYQEVMPINNQLSLLHCTAVYPASAEYLNLKVIETYRQEFPEIVIGFSNHFNGISVDPVAYCLGARIIEKHFTLNRAMQGSDHSFSLEFEGMRKLVRDLRRVRLALGDGLKKFYPEEEPAKYRMGKCIVTTKSLPAGHILTKKDLALKSPCEGLPPYLLDELIGKKTIVALKTDQPLSLKHLESFKKPARKTNGHQSIFPT
ncbi:N-acetylneuraminate synthase family protein [Candidatus Daviesbacteria bacterium]|nr:N-acetylneuraminate synthase family protein [Candidatus Daviesbacteria bacterium]